MKSCDAADMRRCDQGAKKHFGQAVMLILIAHVAANRQARLRIGIQYHPSHMVILVDIGQIVEIVLSQSNADA
jgi:hypothetical protein